MVSLDIVNHSNVHALNLKNFIEAFVQKTGAKTDYKVLEESILEKRSIMIILGEYNDYAGYFVLTEEYNEFGELELLVWAAYAIKPFSKNVIDAGMEKIHEIAKEINAKRIFFKTNRKGWQRRAAKYGFKPAEYTFEIEVQK
jgi:hypothetical protein